MFAVCTVLHIQIVSLFFSTMEGLKAWRNNQVSNTFNRVFNIVG